MSARKTDGIEREDNKLKEASEILKGALEQHFEATGDKPIFLKHLQKKKAKKEK